MLGDGQKEAASILKADIWLHVRLYKLLGQDQHIVKAK